MSLRMTCGTAEAKCDKEAEGVASVTSERHHRPRVEVEYADVTQLMATNPGAHVLHGVGIHETNVAVLAEQDSPARARCQNAPGASARRN